MLPAIPSDKREPVVGDATAVEAKLAVRRRV